MAVLPSTKMDCEYNALKTAGYTGAEQDMELAWLRNNGATSTNLPTAWIQFLNVQLTALAQPITGNRATDEETFYKAVISGGDQTTYGKSLIDLRRTFWCGGYSTAYP